MVLVAIFFFTLSVGKVVAISAPSFPSCENPSGTLRVSYENGIHGIAGQSAEYRGSDKVYTLSESQVLQCFCPADANGIQTDWWKADQLSQDDIDALLSSGWVYIPNGALWGLDPDPYLARNSSFSCGGVGGWSNSSNTSSVLGSVTSTVQSVYPQILGFAQTGQRILQTALMFLGLLFILIALAMLWFQRESHTRSSTSGKNAILTNPVTTPSRKRARRIRAK